MLVGRCKCFVCSVAALTRPHEQTILTASCWWSIGLALHKSPSPCGDSHVSPFLDHSYSHHPKGSSDGVRTGSQGSVLPVITLPVTEPLPSPYCTWHHTAGPYEAPVPSHFLWVASSSHSCLRICSRVAQAASFSFSRAASLSRTPPDVNSGEGITFL